MKICGFEHLHLHTHVGSLLDGYGHPEEYAERAVNINQKFFCVTDHGMMAAIPRQIRACDNYNLSPIFGCLIKGQIIYVADGIKSVESIQKNDLVLTHKGRYRPVIKTMNRIHNGKFVDIIMADNGRKITLTDEHPVLIRNMTGEINWIRADEIKAGRKNTKVGLNSWNSYLCFPKEEKTFKQFINVLDYMPSFIGEIDGILTKIKGRREKDLNYNWSNIPITIELDEDLAYLFGLFVAEGSFFVRNNEFTGDMRFSLHEQEKELVLKIKKILLEKFKIKCQEYPDKRLSHKSFDVCFCCLPLAYIFSAICGCDCMNKKISDLIFKSELSIKLSFIDGLLDGYGKKLSDNNKGSQKTLKVVSKTLAWQFKRILADINYWANVSEIFSDECIEYQVAFSPLRNLYNNKYVFKAIKDCVIYQDCKEVFNFEVEEDNSYVSDCVLHNCELYVNSLQMELKNGNEAKDYYKSLELDEEKYKFKKSYHLLAIAKNNIGYSNLVKLTSWAWTKGYYGKPRVNHNILKEHKEGIIFTSCCYNSEVGQAFDKYGEDAGFDKIEEYLELFGKENYYLEMMLLDFNKQRAYNQFIIKAADKYNLDIILTQDVHYAHAADSDMQRIMLMLQTKRTMKELEKLKNEGVELFELQDTNLWMKSEDELNQKWILSYQDIPLEIFEKAKENTVRLANLAKGVILDRNIKPPMFDDEKEKLLEAIKIGFRFRGISPKGEYLDRVKKEYNLICDKGFCSYFLAQKCMTDEARVIARRLGIAESQAIGPGRGSAVSSLICYLLGITDVDPIKEDLLFDRFLSPARGGKQYIFDIKQNPIE